MESTIEITIQLPVNFNISKGQPETIDNPGYPDQIEDFEFIQGNAVEIIQDAIDKDKASINAELLDEAIEAKKETLYDKAVNDFNGGFKI